MKETRPFSMKDKIGYTLGDLGCCCTEQFRAMYLAIFYTLPSTIHSSVHWLIATKTQEKVSLFLGLNFLHSQPLFFVC